MSFEMVENVRQLTLGNTATFAVSFVLIAFSYWFKDRNRFMQKYCIPAPIAGGLLFSLLSSVLSAAGVVSIQIDTSFQDLTLVAFFTTIGLGSIVDKKFLKTGGKLLAVFYILESCMEFVQGGWAIYGGKAMGLEAPYGFLCGTVTMLGGVPGGAAWGSKLEALGFAGATGVGIAAGTFGLIAGGVLAAPVGRYFIHKYKLKPTEDQMEYEVQGGQANPFSGMSVEKVTKQLTLLFVTMTVGTLLGEFIMAQTGLYILPFVGSLFVGVLIANINHRTKWMEIDNEFLDKLGAHCLNLFLTLAFLTLDLWELKDLMGTVSIILIGQVVLMLLYSYLMFVLLGKSYDSAIITSGFVGHGLGSMVTAVASMDQLTEKYGPSKKAYLIVPLVGAMLIDFVAVPFETFCFNLALSLV